MASAWTSTTTQRDLAGQLRQHAVGGLKGTVHRTHEGASQQAERGHRRAVAGGGQGELAARRVGREVGRLADAVVLLQRRDDLRFLVDVIAQRHQIDAGLAELAVEAGVNPEPLAAFSALAITRSMLLVRDQHRQRPLHERHARRTHDVADEKKPHMSSMQDNASVSARE